MTTLDPWGFQPQENTIEKNIHWHKALKYLGL